MKVLKGEFWNILGLVIAVALSVGFILPVLFSAKSSVLVWLGIALALGLFLFVIEFATRIAVRLSAPKEEVKS